MHTYIQRVEDWIILKTKFVLWWHTILSHQDMFSCNKSHSVKGWPPLTCVTFPSREILLSPCLARSRILIPFRTRPNKSIGSSIGHDVIDIQIYRPVLLFPSYVSLLHYVSGLSMSRWLLVTMHSIIILKDGLSKLSNPSLNLHAVTWYSALKWTWYCFIFFLFSTNVNKCLIVECVCLLTWNRFQKRNEITRRLNAIANFQSVDDNNHKFWWAKQSTLLLNASAWYLFFDWIVLEKISDISAIKVSSWWMTEMSGVKNCCETRTSACF